VIGRHRDVDMATGAPGRPGYDAQTKFGAGALYDDCVAFPWVHAPEETRPAFWHTSKVSNRTAEHNIGNMPVRIVVAQLPPPKSPRNLKNLISRPLVLRPGNQSLGGR
jgi:hypothetical protein